MKPALFEHASIREQFRDPMDCGAPDRGARDFTGLEGRLEIPASSERPAPLDLARENRFIQRLLDDRDRQFAALQEEVAVLKGDWAWRTLCLFRRAFVRLRRHFWWAAP
jgi:hypothetical protein